MNTQLLKSIAWKEYRVLRPIWLAMLAITIAMQLLVLVSFALPQKSVPTGNDPVTWLFAVALTMSAMYALGCTAALFSAEREEGTHEFLKLRAVSPRRLVAHKAGIGILSTTLLLLALCCSATFLLGGQLPTPETQGKLWKIIGLAILEVFAWGTLFSLLLKQPLRAAVLAITAATVTVQLVPYVYEASYSEYQFFSHYLNIFPERVCVLLVLIAINIWLAGHWFDRPWFKTSLSPSVRKSNRTHRSSLIDHLRLSAGGSMFARLLWQQWHQTKGTTFAIGVGAVVLLVCCASDRRDNSDLPWFVSVLSTALLGACCFLPDKQQQGYRFMVTHAVPPNLMWLSRQCVGLVNAFLLSGLLLPIGVVITWLIAINDYPRIRNEGPETDLLGLGTILLVFAAGQLCSLLFRGGLLACFFGLALAGLLMIWAFAMLEIGASWWWSVAPLPVAFWLTTWVRTPTWLLERTGWRSWLPVTLTLGIPTLAILVAVPCFRVYQIPFRDPGFSVNEFSPPITLDEKTTADMYRRAAELINPRSMSEDAHQDESSLWQPPKLTIEEIRWVKQNQPSIELALEASSREMCVFDDPSSGPIHLWGSFYKGSRLVYLLSCSARTLQSEGKLDEAFDRYLAILRLANHLRIRGGQSAWWQAYYDEQAAYQYLPSWAAAEGQTPERIRAALAALELVQSVEPSLADVFKSDYIRGRRICTTSISELGNLHLDGEEERSIIFGRYLLPWELVRARRLLDLLISESLAALDSIQESPSDSQQSFEASSFLSIQEFLPWWIQTTLQVESMNSLMDPAGFRINSRYFIASRHAALIQMALAAWYLEHNALPQTLDELVGPYFEELPLDPYTGKPFRYRPEGFATPVRFDSPNKSIPAGWPLIWSPGPDQAQLVLVGEDEAGNAIYELRGTSEGHIQGPPKHGHFGLAFPLPALPSTEQP